MRAIAALTVVSTFMSGPFTTAAGADPAAVVAQVTEATVDQKIEALNQIGPLTPTPPASTYSLRDCDFVIFVWDKAKVPDNARVKEAAAAAFTSSSSDPESCYRFIAQGIFTAHREDQIERLRKSERDRQRLEAAKIVMWTGLTQADLDCELKEFVFRLWERAKPNSEVKTKAAAVLTPTSTDEQRTAYVVTEIFAARTRDQQRELEEAERIERERRERLANESARASAWGVATGTTITDPIKLMTDREFVYEIYRRGTGKWVKAEAGVAAGSSEASAWKAYIFTGVHAAHQKDLEDQNRQEAVETAARIKEILDRAERDGFMPNLASAARAALGADLGARRLFLTAGQHEAFKRDQIKPSNRRVVELQNMGSGSCLQTAGVDSDAMNPGAYMELWTCLVGHKQLWELFQYDNDQYMIRGMHSKLCLSVLGQNVGQTHCDSGAGILRWKFVENPADGTFQMQNVATGRFATALSSGVANGTAIVEGGNTKTPDQFWRLIDPTHRANVLAVESGWVQVKGVESGRCLQTAGIWDVPGQGANADLAEQELWDCVGGNKMKWKIVPLGENKYALENAQSGKCLDVRYGDWPNGSALIQFACHYGGTQQFVFVQGGDNTYGLQSALTLRYADVVGHHTENGSGVDMWEFTGLANQRWTLAYV
ncbi:RICIN domain-containing protein [Lentzea californiensis]|uniref:RICIN domain-containing protein n=1 Tax=Lentzea californiensis TaxID=438851 RepID=UPI0021662D93|nr:RICIN domain-containing protein [Lentzea californiensis]MCR3752387.1 Ricin-type beta-trefoil lectin domain-containing protein [Lentzea californiensis]